MQLARLRQKIKAVAQRKTAEQLYNLFCGCVVSVVIDIIVVRIGVFIFSIIPIFVSIATPVFVGIVGGLVE